jgi:hypothetical protein
VIAVPISAWTLAWFEFRRAAVLFAMPVLLGFLVAVLYPLGQKAAAQSRAFLRVTVLAALGPAAMLFGWTLIVRTHWTALPYGLGYGLGAAALSRVHKLSLWPPKVVLRRSKMVTVQRGLN